jgi:hypothetical protein
MEILLLDSGNRELTGGLSDFTFSCREIGTFRLPRISDIMVSAGNSCGFNALGFSAHGISRRKLNKI